MQQKSTLLPHHTLTFFNREPMRCLEPEVLVYIYYSFPCVININISLSSVSHSIFKAYQSDYSCMQQINSLKIVKINMFWSLFYTRILFVYETNRLVYQSDSITFVNTEPTFVTLIKTTKKEFSTFYCHFLSLQHFNLE